MPSWEILGVGKWTTCTHIPCKLHDRLWTFLPRPYLFQRPWCPPSAKWPCASTRRLRPPCSFLHSHPFRPSFYHHRCLTDAPAHQRRRLALVLASRPFPALFFMPLPVRILPPHCGPPEFQLRLLLPPLQMPAGPRRRLLWRRSRPSPFRGRGEKGASVLPERCHPLSCQPYK